MLYKYQWLLDFLNEIARLSNFYHALYKKEDVFYFDLDNKSRSFSWLHLFPDGILMPGHIRQINYSVSFIMDKMRTANELNVDIFPQFTTCTKYGFRVALGKNWSPFVPVITTDSKLMIRLASYFYPNLKHYFK